MKKKVTLVSHQKVKARDIIPNWPRGRSVMNPYPNYHYGMFFRAFRIRLPFACSQSELITHLEDERKYDFEDKYETIYHEMQQAMVNEWFARYRLGDEVFRKQHERYIQAGEYGTCMVLEDFILEEDLDVLDVIDILKGKKE